MVIESLLGVWAGPYLAKKMNWGSYGCLKIVALGSHKQHRSVFLILIRSYIKRGCAAITDPKQPWADVGLTEAKRIYGSGKKRSSGLRSWILHFLKNPGIRLLCSQCTTYNWLFFLFTVIFSSSKALNVKRIEAQGIIQKGKYVLCARMFFIRAPPCVIKNVLNSVNQLEK